MDNTIVKINPNTWRIEDGFVRFFLLTGSERALLIDSGASCPDVLAIARSLTDLPLMLLNTHGDGDHTSANGSFGEFYMHPADYENCGAADQFPNSRLLPLKGGETIDLGGRQLQIIAIPGHTYGSIAVLDRGSRILFSGDSVQTGQIYMFGKHRVPEQFADSLRILAEQDGFDTICPSHGAPELPANYTEKVLDAWNRVRAGEVQGTKENLFGNTVDSYTLDSCGFYC